MQGGRRHILKGLLAALRFSTDPNQPHEWRRHFNLRPEGLKSALLALAGCVPLYLIGARAASAQSAAGPAFPMPVVVLVLGLFVASFPIAAYLICQLIDRMDLFRPWVIVRCWATLCLAVIIGLAFGAALLGVLPYGLASQIALLAYVSTLIIDIRLCQSVAEMDWMPAIFSACAISAIGLLTLLAGFASAANV